MEWNRGFDGESVTYSYDELGNLIGRKGPDAIDQYMYGGEGFGPHQLRLHKEHRAGSTSEFKFDALGRRVFGGRQARVDYNRHDLPNFVKSVDGVTAEFLYGAMGDRVAKRTQSGMSVYLGQLFERRDMDEGKAYVAHVFAEGREVAQLSFEPDRPVDAGLVQAVYLHPNRLGSASLVTDEGGGVLHEQRFEPFGGRLDDGRSEAPETASDPLAVRDGFTGHEHDDDIGLINMNGRVYDPETRSFLTTDPVDFFGFSQGLNPYAYVHQRPLRFVDPTGFQKSPPQDGEPDELPPLTGGPSDYPPTQPITLNDDPADEGAGSESTSSQPGQTTSSESNETGSESATTIPAPFVIGLGRAGAAAAEAGRVRALLLGQSGVLIFVPFLLSGGCESQIPRCGEVDGPDPGTDPESEPDPTGDVPPAPLPVDPLPDDGDDDGEDNTITVYRVESDLNRRVVIGEDGSVQLLPGTMLWVSFGELGREHSTRWIEEGKGAPGPGRAVRTFEVHRAVVDDIRARSVSEEEAGENPDSPIQSPDPPRGAGFGLRAPDVVRLQGAVVPGSGRETYLGDR